MGGVAKRAIRTAVPGMGHCRGLDGTDNFDMVSALEGWVEKGKAPDRIVASRVRDGKVDRSRAAPTMPRTSPVNYLDDIPATGTL